MLETGGEWKGFDWQTVDGHAPTDTPECGFYGELCPVVQQGNIIRLHHWCER